MFDHWGLLQCPVIPTNLTRIARAGIAAEIRKHNDGSEFEAMHAWNPHGGMLVFSDGRNAWDLPTKRDLAKGRKSDVPLMIEGLDALLRHGVPELQLSGVEVILLPKIGTGLGGLDWNHVWDAISPKVTEISHEIDVAVYAERMDE